MTNQLIKLSQHFDWAPEIGGSIGLPIDLTAIVSGGPSPKAICLALMKEINEAGPGGQWATFGKNKWIRTATALMGGDEEKIERKRE